MVLHSIAQQAVAAFAAAFSLPSNTALEPNDLLELRARLVDEEAKEVSDAVDDIFKKGVTPETKEHLLKELADLVYVVYGLADAFGLPLDDAVSRVHISNMSKLVDGVALRREDGKVLKGPNYTLPYLKDLI